MAYTPKFHRHGEHGFVNITSNELGLLPQGDGNEAHVRVLNAVPFSVAGWHTDPIVSARSNVDYERRTSYTKDYLTKHLARAADSECSSIPFPGRSGTNTLYPARSRDTIRVFEILSSRPRGNLVGRLHEVDMEFEWHNLEFKRINFALVPPTGRVVCYTALSYCWGPPIFDKIITIDGQDKRVTSTLFDALMYLRHEKHSGLLWIDQLCIDQDSIADKEAQIMLMDKIYSRAHNTAIWLGPEQYKGATKALEGMYEVLRYRNQDDLLEDEVQDFLYPPMADDEHALHNLRNMLAQPWFQRTWVIQEACLSRQPFLMTGHATTTWEDFTTWCRIVADVLKSSAGDTPHQDHARWIEGLNAAAQLDRLRNDAELGLQLLGMLVDTRYAQVSKPLDKVFGILGLCRSRISVDYSKEPVALWNEVAVEIVQDSISNKPGQIGNLASLELFHLLCCMDHEPGHDGLASWAVDWSIPRLSTSLGYDAVHRALYNAGGPMNHSSRVQLDAATMVLQISGGVFDEVQLLSDVFDTAELSADNCLTANDSLRLAIAFANTCSQQPSETAFLNFCETLVTGRDGVGQVRYPHRFTEILSVLCDATTGHHPSFTGQTYTLRQRKGYFTTANLKTRTAGRAFQSLRRGFKAALLHRRLAWTKDGRLCLVPRYTCAGDVLCIFLCSVMPFVLRRRQDGDYALVGECYVHDVMLGQLLREDQVPVVDIRLR